MKYVNRVFDETLSTSENLYENSFTWDYKEKIEFDMLLNNSVKVINIGLVDSIKLIIVEADSPCRVLLTTESDSIEMEIDNTFILTPTESMQNSITEFSIEEYSGLDANVRVRVYGENQES